MPAKKRRPHANDNVAQFQRQFLAEYDETMRSVLIELLTDDAGPERRNLRELSTGLNIEALK